MKHVLLAKSQFIFKLFNDRKKSRDITVKCPSSWQRTRKHTGFFKNKRGTEPVASSFHIVHLFRYEEQSWGTQLKLRDGEIRFPPCTLPWPQLQTASPGKFMPNTHPDTAKAGHHPHMPRSPTIPCSEVRHEAKPPRTLCYCFLPNTLCKFVPLHRFPFADPSLFHTCVVLVRQSNTSLPSSPERTGSWARLGQWNTPSQQSNGSRDLWTQQSPGSFLWFFHHYSKVPFWHHALDFLSYLWFL